VRFTIRAISVFVLAGVALVVPLTNGSLVGVDAAGATTATCHTSWLTTKLGRSSGATGTTWYTLEIVNHSKMRCSLSGTPIARPGFATYGMVPWEKVGPKSGVATFAGRGGTVVIRPGAVASVDFGVETAGNYPPSQCAPRSIFGVQVTFASPAAPTVRLGFPLPKQAVCTKRVSTSITGIALGTHFP
jgi:Protein of unknown function (DUF4232)